MTRALEEAKKVEVESVVKKLLARDMSADEIRGITYIYYAYDHKYSSDKHYTIPKNATIGKCLDVSSETMYPNTNFLKYFPAKDNPRILKQDGAFIVSGLDASAEESNNKIRKFIVLEITIPKDFKKQIREELEHVGINQASLFPEVDKVADYLRKKT